MSKSTRKHVNEETFYIHMKKFMATRHKDAPKSDENQSYYDSHEKIGLIDWYGEKYFDKNFAHLLTKAKGVFETHPCFSGENIDNWDIIVEERMIPVRKTGKWTDVGTPMGFIKAKCSACNCVIKTKIRGSIEFVDMSGVSYCPNCGAEMED